MKPGLLLPNVNELHGKAVVNSSPSIVLTMARPVGKGGFFDLQTQAFYDLQQIIIN